MEIENSKQRALRGEGVDFIRINRITGYLVDDVSHWVDSKKAEESMRVKHAV